MNRRSSVKVGDLVKIDYKGYKLSVEFLDLFRKDFCGIIIDKFARQYDKAEYITIITTDGEHKTFPCSPELPPNITVVSDRDH
tara:strand:- start:876 stop:1124 length:249 start_codon:yes stop_codon:yes gene_type:complete